MVRKRKRTWVTSRQITTSLIYEVLNDHPHDLLVALQARTRASEAQCIIAIKREVRRGNLIKRTLAPTN